MADETEALAGRALDAAVAELMRWMRVTLYTDGTCDGLPPGEDVYIYEIGNYSTDETAAAEVREWVRGCVGQNGRPVVWRIHGMMDQWVASIDYVARWDDIGSLVVGRANAPTLPEAICRAAVAAGPWLRRREE